MGIGIYRTSQWFLRRIFWLWGGLSVHGRENERPDGPLVVACSHASFLDPMILGAAFDRDLHFMARKTLFDIPLFSWLIRQNQAFPLNREGDSREAIRAFGELLEKNKAVVMFPEGTRSRTGVVGEMKTGVGMLSVRNQTPVLPVYIWGSYQSWPRGRRFPSRHRLKVYMGEVITPSADKALRKAEQERITREVDKAIRGLEAAAWEGESDPPAALLARNGAGAADAVESA